MPQNQEINDSRLLIEQLDQRDRGIDCIGLSGSEKAYLAACIVAEQHAGILAILPTAKDAERFINDLSFFIPARRSEILYFPPYNILPFSFLSYHSETAARRIRTLYQLLEANTYPIAVTSVDALMQKIIPRQVISQYAELIAVNEELERDHLISKLIFGGYVRSTIVEEPGDFSVRGGIVDIFNPLYSNPLRIEWYGDQVDAIRFSAHKLRGPQGVGALVVGHRPRSLLISGGEQENKRRGGTENVAGIVGLGKAAELASLEFEQRRLYLGQLRDVFEARLATIPGCVVFGQQAPRLPNTTFFALPYYHGETLLMELDREGFALSSGSACHSMVTEPSHVLKAMSVDSNLALNAIRVSFGMSNSLQEVEALFASLQDRVNKLPAVMRQAAV